MDKNNIFGARTRTLKDLFSNNKTLQQLSMNSCNLCEEGCFYLAMGLGIHPSLKKLSLAYNSIRDEGFNALAISLTRMNFKLTHLDVAGNFITDSSGKFFAE